MKTRTQQKRPKGTKMTTSSKSRTVGRTAGTKGRAPGGARSGAGRKPMYSENLDEKAPTRLNEEAAKVVVKHCRAKAVNMNLYLREAALAAAGLSHLGIGLEKAYGTLGSRSIEDPTDVGIQLPVKFTTEQHDALTEHCKKHGAIPLATFIKDAGLKYAGAEKLTTAYQHQQSAKNLTAASAGA